MAEGTTPDPAYQHRLVADVTTAPTMARAFVYGRWKAGRRWVLPLCALVLLPIMFAGTSDAQSTPLRLLGALVYALAFTLIVALVLSAVKFLVYQAALRSLEPRTHEGALLQTSFDEDTFVMSTPVSTARYPYSAVRSAIVLDNVVMLRVDGSNTTHIFPASLFPGDALERLRTGKGPSEPHRA